MPQPADLRWSIRPLQRSDDATAFSSGQDSLDLWIAQHAWACQQRRTAATQVLVSAQPTSERPEAGRVLGYYSLASTSIHTEGLPRRLSRGQPALLPAFLLARLALDRSLQGQGLGSVLLSHAVRAADHASRIVAARLLVVDAIDEHAASFYRHYGFTPLAADHRRRRLVAVIKHLVPPED
ncbi:GNAT family N-acetyltransferase [Actinomyces bowdenii]|uniref:GNAT family N-acetyltransferase n=1 Tax=Actinomyces bowdenii TaxID=131109 RepID=UPI00214CCBCD|nr:GNAT family N-acetyltransferase [Actinomyces bowdenii]MCR2052132.1 GNAT family N-acetyltransferase [Actinomyces bowdenii]